MPSYPLLAVLLLILAYTLSTLRSWSRNVTKAKATGLPYYLIPWSTHNPWWLMVNRTVTPYLRKLPFWQESVEKLAPIHSWDQLYTSYSADHNLDTYLTVAPTGIMMWTCNADVIGQITTRRIDFPKPTHIYRAVNIYGPNLVTTEGQAWRQHRKITNPPFTEKNNHLVWNESIHQAQSMVKSWTGVDGRGNQTLPSIAKDTMHLSLSIISRAGFGVRLLWPGVESNPTEQGSKGTESGDGSIDANGISGSHTMTYTDALRTLLHNTLIVIVLPGYILKRLPWEKAKKAYEAFNEWGQYMTEMVQSKQVQVSSGDEGPNKLDLLGALVKSAGYGPDSPLGKGQLGLTHDEILGNAFIFILAGHETTANTIHYSLILLAMQIATQRRVQADVDSIFGGRSAVEWDYDTDLPKLFGGMVGAVMNETLRLLPPVINIPKMTQTEQSFTINGRPYTVPGGMIINLTTVAAHRNPRYWPAGPADMSDPVNKIWPPNYDLNQFKPERWLLSDDVDSPSSMAAAAGAPASMPSDATSRTDETEDLGVNTAADTSASLYKPIRGSYIPFSEGFRSCIGRRFAQVEVLAVLALILQSWSIELAVDEWASDEEVARMNRAEKRAVWEMARENAWRKFRREMRTRITLQFNEGGVPLRFVRRGEERFAFES